MMAPVVELPETAGEKTRQLEMTPSFPGRGRIVSNKLSVFAELAAIVPSILFETIVAFIGKVALAAPGATVIVAGTIAGARLLESCTVRPRGCRAGDRYHHRGRLQHRYSGTENQPASGSTIDKLTFDPESVVGGSPSTGTVTLTTPAGPRGTLVRLESRHAAAIVPESVLVPPNMTSVSFTVRTNPVSGNTSAVIDARAANSVFGNLLLRAEAGPPLPPPVIPVPGVIR